MNVVGIDFESIADGPGVRVVVYTSGCIHNCDGCHNPTSHDFNAGRIFSDDIKNEIISYILRTPYIKGITFSGGDPMLHADELAVYAKSVKKKIPYINIWVYTGFLYEEILKDNIMNEFLHECDVLVDGKFEKNNKSPTLRYKGSKNQRVIDVKRSIDENHVVIFS